MKVFLMYPDRDFDAKQALPWQADDLIQDLELSILLQTMAQGDDFILEIAHTALLSSLTNPDNIRYRQEILQDCLNNPDIVRAIYQLPIEASANKHKHWLGIFSRHPTGILSNAVQMMEMFLELLRRLRQIADEESDRFSSRGFTRFFAMIRQELDDDFFVEAEGHLNALRFRSGVLLGMDLGKGAEATHYQLRRPENNSFRLRQLFTRQKGCSFRLAQRDVAGARILGNIKDRGLNQVANALAQSSDHVNSFFDILQSELAFYIGAMNLHHHLQTLETPTVFPVPVPAGERYFSTAGLYDVSLALTTGRPPVGNDIETNQSDMFVITGANQGGKSTFLRSVGQAQLMMQSGMFVPASRFSANLATALFTHNRREEDASMTSGKLDEELARMSAIIDHLSPDAMILFNESFAATNEREGSEIARQVVNALLEKHIKIFFVTHLAAFARTCYEQGMRNVLFLRAERRTDGARTFKMIANAPLQTSFGQDLYRQIFDDGTIRGRD
jgi:DNA mismatch repair ATPase MutS